MISYILTLKIPIQLFQIPMHVAKYFLILDNKGIILAIYKEYSGEAIDFCRVLY